MSKTSLNRFFWFWNAVNFLLLVLVVGHQSTSPEVLSRYTRLYALSLVPALVLVILVFLSSLFWCKSISTLLARIPVVWSIIVALLLLIGTIAVWMVPFDARLIKVLITFNGVCCGLWIAFTTTSDSSRMHRVWQSILIGMVAQLPFSVCVVHIWHCRSLSCNRTFWLPIAYLRTFNVSMSCQTLRLWSLAMSTITGGSRTIPGFTGMMRSMTKASKYAEVIQESGRESSQILSISLRIRALRKWHRSCGSGCRTWITHWSIDFKAAD